jgi:hypothetical protein
VYQQRRGCLLRCWLVMQATGKPAGKVSAQDKTPPQSSASPLPVSQVPSSPPSSIKPSIIKPSIITPRMPTMPYLQSCARFVRDTLP